MLKKIMLVLALVIFLSACISVDVDEPPTPEPSNFVTATLRPPKPDMFPPH